MKKIFKSVCLAALAFMLVFASACQPSGGAPSGDGSAQNGGSQGSAARDYILIGIPNPVTGPLSGFGEGTPWAEEYAIKVINDEGGIYIKELDKKLPIRLKVVDTESNPTKASEVAAKLITDDKVDLLVVRHTPDVVNPVSAIAERYGVPCISLDCAVDAWLVGGPYKWTFHSFLTTRKAYETFTGAWKSVGLEGSKVGFLFPNDADGEQWSEKFNQWLPEDGYTVIDPGRYPMMTQDFSTMINQFISEKVDIVVGVDINPDFTTFWKQAKQMGFNPKFVTVGKAYLFESDILAVGEDLGNGLTTDVWWSPWHPFTSSLTGESGKDVTDRWTEESGRVWTPPIGFKYASMEIAIDALKRAESLDKETLRQAIADTDMDTLIGPIKFNEQNYAETPVVTGQWVKTESGKMQINIIDNTNHPEIPITGEIIYPLP